MIFSDIASYILENLDSISVIVASGAAIWGVKSWRREAKWKRKYELGEEVLSLFYEARDKIRLIRIPIVLPGETKDPRKAIAQLADYFYPGEITIKRYNDNIKTFNKIYSLKYRFEAVFGKIKKEKNPFDLLYNLMQEILGAAQTIELDYEALTKIEVLTEIPNNQISPNSAKKRDEIMKRIEKNKKIIWAGNSEDDPIEKEVNKIVRNIEDICRPILQK